MGSTRELQSSRAGVIRKFPRALRFDMFGKKDVEYGLNGFDDLVI